MPEAINIGPFLIPVLPAGIVLALVVAVWLVGRFAARAGLEGRGSRRIAEHAAWVGLLGARLGFALANWRAYASEPWTVLYVWQPGYLWWAGLGAGGGFVVWRLRGLARNKRLKCLGVLFGGFGAAAMLLGALLGSNVLLADRDVLRRGDSVPEFRLQTLDGEPTRFSSLAGRIVVLNFWATWCPPCRREMPLLDEIHDRYASRGVSVIGIDVGESVGVVKAYVESIGVDYPIWVDSTLPGRQADSTTEIYARFGGVGFPTTFFVDHAGVIRDAHVGELSRGLVMSRIEHLLARRARSSS